MLKFMKRYKYVYVKKTNESQNIDKIISKKILYYFDQFFLKKNNKIHTNNTKKHKNINIKNKTIKKRKH
jgi:hypothetical protein